MSQAQSQPSMASMVESAINQEQKEKLAAILKHVSKLSDLEKLYLYLKLPAGQTMEEPAKRTCLAPLSSTNKTSTTLTWIRSHYVEDKSICTPKQEVYNQYRLYCEATNTNPVGSADFGKMVKTAFPNIHHRRLGQRGKSKYCYGGLKRKTQLEVPTLPVLQTKPLENPATVPNPLQEMQNLSSQLICEWACRLFDKKFVDVKSLAQYLIHSGASYGKKAALFSMMYDNCGVSSRLQESKSSDQKLQDTQVLLQRKLHQKEVLKEHMNLLKQQQKHQREMTSVPITAFESSVSNHNRSHIKSCVEDITSAQCNSERPSSNLSMAATFSGRFETGGPPCTKNNRLLSGHNSDIPAANGSKGRCDINSQEKYLLNDLINNGLANVEGHKQALGPKTISKPVSRMSISSESDVSRQSPQKNLEIDDHKHPKRVGDVLTSSSHGRVSKRRRCMTSLGMPHQDLTDDQTTSNNDIDLIIQARIRPFSCPTLCDISQTGSSSTYSNKSSSKETLTSKKRQSMHHWKEKGNVKSKDKQRSTCVDEGIQKRLTLPTKSTCKWTVDNDKSDKSSFHFVQKPTVIPVRQPGTLLPSVMSCPNFSNPQEQDSKDSRSNVKKTYNILNSLLSSDTNSFPKPMSETSLYSQSFTKQQLKGLDNSLSESGQKLPHTLDNAYIISSQSNRSAFVPVASNKLQDFSRSRSSHPCLSMYAPSRGSSSERPRTDTTHSPFLTESEMYTCNSNLFMSSDDEAAKGAKLDQDSNRSSQLTSPDNASSQNHVSNCSVIDSSASDHFKPITYSTSQATNSFTSVISYSSATPTSMVSSSPVAQTKSSTQKALVNSSSVLCVSKQPNKTGAKSPVTPPRRQSRSRFTPIRPKISGCAPSPQKKDMRPVSMILKEQRVRNAQDLLVSLANTYQGEVKLQMPAELLGLTPPSKTRSSDVFVTIGTPGGGFNRPASALPAMSANNEITVVLEPQSKGAPSISSPMSSLSVNSSSLNTQVSGIEQCQENNPQSQTGAVQPINGSRKNLAGTDTLNSQLDTVSSNLIVDSGQETKLVISDHNGTIYTLDKDSDPFPLSQNVKNRLHLTTVPRCNSSSKDMHNVINIADINGQVIGPDDKGQTYLIVPSSENTPIESKLESSVGSTGYMGLQPSETSFACRENDITQPDLREAQKSIQAKPSAIGVSSSSALLSELSQLASASKQEKTQTLIQHDSALSAFHKCAPNKQPTLTSASVQGSNSYVEESLSVVSETFTENSTTVSLPVLARHSVNMTKPLSIGKHNHNEPISPLCHSVRKRKASKSREVGVKDNKRQNTSEREEKYNECDDDVVIIDEVDQGSKPDESLSIDSSLNFTNKTFPCENMPRKTEIDFSDTDTLLQMINSSRSLTVKQTVIAINSLREEMKKKKDSSGPLSGTSNDLLTRLSLQQKSTEEASLNRTVPQSSSDDAGERMGKGLSTGSVVYVSKERTREGRNICKETSVDKQRPAPTISHSSKRNMSLNLESLESDALLDNEPTLDHRLMGDVRGESKMRKSDNKTSVAVVAKTSQSSSFLEQEEVSKKSKGPRSTYTISANTLRSYQMLLNEQKATDVEDRVVSNKYKNDSVESCEAHPTKRPSHNISKSTRSSSSGLMSLPRRSLSCVRDILERRNSSALNPITQDKSSNIDKSGGAEYFDALLSKMQSKANEPVNSSSGMKLKSQKESDLDIPLDVVDFVTESMSSQSMYNFPSARCVSVPNTRPDYFNLDDSVNLTMAQKMPPSDTSDNASSISNEYSAVFYDQKQIDLFTDKTDDLDHATSDKQNVFLSPVGPVKSARRLSIEKSVTQPPVDRSMAKTPVEFASLRHGSDSSPMKTSSGVKGQNVERQLVRTPVDRVTNHSERKRAKTPFDTIMNIQVSDKKGGKAGLSSQSSDEVISSKGPVNRSLTRTPMDKFFHKIVTDSLLSKYQIENLSQQSSRGQLSGNDDSSSQTPTSDAGYGSVSETPVSDFGYNSISPSPVMMSSSSFFGECGRRDITSPATIFMPLRSDSALSLNNNTSEHAICSARTNFSDILPSVSSQIGDNFSDDPDHSNKIPLDIFTSSDCLSNMQSSLSTNPSQVKQLHLQVELGQEGEQNKSKNDNEMSEPLDFSKLVSLHSIPTPPFSPNSTLTTTAPTSHSPLQFSIPFSPLPNHDNSPSPPSVPRFLLPCSTSTNTTLSLHYHHSSSNSSPPRLSYPQDHQSPSIAHILTPSPHILARPPSSPNHCGTHPSPPFTPGSQRSLPSPCPTPSSFKSLISPRSLTPSLDSSQAPNGFMPIQSSCVQTASLAPTHAYIQPIKPVVTLASPSSNVAGIQSRAPPSRSDSGILSPSIGTVHDEKRLIHDRYTPNVSLIPVDGSLQNILEKPPRAFCANQSSLSTQDCQNSRSRLINPMSDFVETFTARGSYIWNEVPTSNTTHGQMLHTFNSGQRYQNCNLDMAFLQKREVDMNDMVGHKGPLQLLTKSSSFQNQKKRQSPSSKTSSQLNRLATSHQDSQQLSPSNSQLLIQTNSPFTAITSKLQVDLTKLETSQNPTCTVQTKPFQTGQCKIDLDNCDRPSSLQVTSVNHNSFSNITPVSLTRPSTKPFDTGKQTSPGTNYSDLGPINTTPVDHMWNNRLSKPSCQDDLQATLEVLRDMDSQYFPSDEDNSIGGSPAS